MSVNDQPGPARDPLTLGERLRHGAGRAFRWVPDSVSDFVLKLTALIIGRRVTGLAAEAAFWLIFSLPWLMLAFVSGLGMRAKYLGAEAVENVRDSIEQAINNVLTPEAAQQFAVPVLHDLFNETRPQLGIIGLFIALWAGSRAVMTYVQAIMLINGEFVQRSYLRRRGLSLLLYAVTAILAILFVPMLMMGPKRIGQWVDISEAGITISYLVIVLICSLTFLLVLFHFATVTRGSLRSVVPGALVAIVAGAAAVWVVTIYVRGLFEASSVYGVLATPVALMVYAFVLSFVVLLGAAVNAVAAKREIFARDVSPEHYFERSTKIVEKLTEVPGDR